jgi:hypothetical protein
VRKIEKYIDYLVDGIKAYVDNKINKANFDKTENGQIVAINSNSTYNVKVGKNIYTNVKTLGGTCALNEIVKVVSPQNQPSNMFISKSGGSGGGSSYILPQATSSVLGGVYVDTELSGESENPIQNKIIKQRLDEVFTSVSDGKRLVASAITDKGVSTEDDATFQVMANNINDIATGNASNTTITNFKSSISYFTTSYSQEKISP